MTDRDEQFMSTALACAEKGRGAVEPNPMVGAVIVHGGRELARGWHRRFGGPHAEREAFAAAGRDRADVRGATMYVTLEPCCHHGKTPPCTDVIVEAGIARVVVAMSDPDENVAGRGIETLRRAGVEVDVGVCGPGARKLLRSYIKLRTLRRPWVICKWAQTADGYLSLPPGAGRWISGPAARTHVHEIRAWCDGILVGAGTVLADDPLLTNRSGRGKQPTRVVLDSQLRIPAACRLVRTARESPLLVATTRDAVSTGSAAANLSDAGAELIELPPGAGGVDIGSLLDELGRREWTYVLVEGGAEVLASFVHGRLADELLAFVSPVEAGGGAGLPRFDIADVKAKLALGEAEETRFGDDVLLRYVLTD